MNNRRNYFWLIFLASMILLLSGCEKTVSGVGQPSKGQIQQDFLNHYSSCLNSVQRSLNLTFAPNESLRFNDEMVGKDLVIYNVLVGDDNKTIGVDMIASFRQYSDRSGFGNSYPTSLEMQYAFKRGKWTYSGMKLK